MAKKMGIGAWVIGLLAAGGAGLGIYRLASGRWPWSKAPQLPQGEMPAAAESKPLLTAGKGVVHLYAASKLSRTQRNQVTESAVPIWTAESGGEPPLPASVKAAVPDGLLLKVWGPMILGPEMDGYMVEVVVGSGSEFYLLHPREFQLAS